MAGIPPTFMLEKCDVCNEADIKQNVEPQLRYITGANGYGISVQCCQRCTRKIDAEEQAFRDSKKKSAGKSGKSKPDPS